MEEKKRRSVQNKRVTRPDRDISSQGGRPAVEDSAVERPAEHRQYREPQQPAERRQHQRPAEPAERRQYQRPAEPAERRQYQRSAEPSERRRPQPAEDRQPRQPQRAAAAKETLRASKTREPLIPGFSAEHVKAFRAKVRPILKRLGKKAGKVGKTMGPTAHKIFDVASPLSDKSFKIRGIVAAALLAFVLLFTVAGIPQAAQLAQLQSTVNQQQEELAAQTAQNDHDQQVVDARDAALKAYQS